MSSGIILSIVNRESSIVNRQSSIVNRSRIHLIGFGAFLILSLILLRPLPWYFTTRFQGYGDTWVMIWNFWWMGKAFAMGVNPFWTDYVYYPIGVDLHFHGYSPLNSVLSVPFQSFMGAIALNNFFFVSTFVLAGYSAYLCAHLLTGNVAASLLSGYIFAFSPYHFSHRHQIEHLSICWIAFFLLALLRFAEKRSAPRAVAAALFFLATFYANVYYGLFTAVLAGSFFIYDVFCCCAAGEGTGVGAGVGTGEGAGVGAATGGRPYVGWAIMAGCVAVGILPFLVPMFRLAGNPGRFKVPLWINVYQSQDLLAFISPSPHNPLLASWFPTMLFYDTFTAGEPVGYLGFSVIALAAVGYARSVHPRRKFLAFATLLFLLLSLGPVLHVAGIVKVAGRFPIPLPQSILQAAPVISAARVPARYIAIAMLPLALLAGLGADELMKASRRVGAAPGVAGQGEGTGCHFAKKLQSCILSPGARLVVPLLVALVVIEYWNAPMVMTQPRRPAYCGVLAADPEDCAVMDLPLRISQNPAEWWKSMDPDEKGWFQTLHGKRTMTGPISHTALTRDHFLYFLRSPILSPLVGDSLAADPASPASLDTLGMSGAIDRSSALLRDMKLKYFVLHKKTYFAMGRGQFERDETYIEKILGAKVRFEDDDEVVLQSY